MLPKKSFIKTIIFLRKHVQIKVFNFLVGVVGCQVAVVAIDTSKQTITSHKMKNINSYNEIIFSDTGMTVKQSYGIGAGLSFSHNKLGQFSVAPQNETGCVLIKNFSQPSITAGSIQFSQSQRTTNYEFSCTEAGCTLSFDSYKSLEDHVHLGEHQMAMETQTTFDKVRRQWGKYCNSIFVSEKKQLSIQNDENDQNMNVKVPRGWALKQTKTKARFERHVIDYLRSKYQEGELTGRKITPQEVEREMKNIRHENGEKVFRISECLSSSQIASYFARYGKNSAKENQDNPVINDEDLTSVLSAIEENNLMELLS